jgi:hypothetical protein
LPGKADDSSSADAAAQGLSQHDVDNHQIGHGPEFHRLACEHGVEGIVPKRINSRYGPDKRTWLKIKCLNREGSANASPIYHSSISRGPFCEARNFAVHRDPRQRVVTKNLPARCCDGRIIKRPDI